MKGSDTQKTVAARWRLSKTYLLVSVAVMSTLSIILDLIPLPRVVWGMKIDFVGTIWVLSFFLYGASQALSVALVTALYIALLSNTGYVGAVMKFLATVPMFLVPAAFTKIPVLSKKGSGLFNNILITSAVALVASAMRLLVATLVNLYWAIPIWFNMTPESVLAYFGGIVPLIVFVAGMNTVQGIVDVYVSWFAAFKLKLSDRFGTW